MTEDYQYFLRPAEDGTIDPPRALWRRAGDRWEYLSTRDWSWHEPVPGQGPSIPPIEWLTPITPQRAAELAADRQRWVRYWAWYLDPPTSVDERPRSVVRRRRSPEGRLDEGFTIDNRWERTEAIIEAELPQVSDPPHLVEIDQLAAEQILREVRGVEGATEL